MAVLERFQLDVYRSLAGTRGGRCLSTRFQNTRSNLAWECALGHRWSAAPKATAEAIVP